MSLASGDKEGGGGCFPGVAGEVEEGKKERDCRMREVFIGGGSCVTVITKTRVDGCRLAKDLFAVGR